jgi:hypothetical protein
MRWYQVIAFTKVKKKKKNESVETTNEMQPCNRICYSKIYWRLNVFRAAYHSSSGASNYICSLWFIYPCRERSSSRLRVPTQHGQRPITTWVYKPKAANTVWSSWWWAVWGSKHVEPSINFGIINSITRLHFVGYFYWFILRCTDSWILNLKKNDNSRTSGYVNRYQMKLCVTLSGKRDRLIHRLIHKFVCLFITFSVPQIICYNTVRYNN